MTATETAILEEHLDSCDACRVEQRVTEAMRFSGGNGPAPALDELTARRNIDQALARAAAAERSVDSRGIRKGRGRRWIALAACAVLAMGIAAALFFRDASLPEEPSNRIAAVPSPIGGDLLLSTGQVQLDGARAGLNKIASKSTLNVENGAAVARLQTGIKLFVNRRSKLSFTNMDSDRIDVDLSNGEIVADVDPQRQGPPFVVKTPHGRARVAGTVFSVDVDAERTVVRVLRGRVETLDASGQVKIVKLGQSIAIGQGAVEQIAPEEIELANERLRMIDLVIAPDAAELDVTSLPHGAVLLVDGIELGVTPIVAMIRPGARNLTLAKKGHESVKELLHVSPGSKVTRVFELKELGSDSDLSKRDTRFGQRTARSGESAEELLDAAQAHRQKGRWKKSLLAYEQLAEQYPNTALGRAALVSMGQIQTERLGRHREALKSFNRYLKTTRHGTLALEAALGRAQALRALGDKEAERAALQEFLRDFPEAIQAPRVRDRLNRLQ